jgi:hypothetical protein
MGAFRDGLCIDVSVSATSHEEHCADRNRLMLMSISLLSTGEDFSEVVPAVAY